MEQRRGAAGRNSSATSNVYQKLHSQRQTKLGQRGKKFVEKEGQRVLWPHKSQTVDRMEGSDENGKWSHSLRPAVFDRRGFMVC